MAWNKPAFYKFYSTDEKQTFPNIGTVFIHQATVIHVSKERNSTLKALRSSEYYTMHC